MVQSYEEVLVDVMQILFHNRFSSRIHVTLFKILLKKKTLLMNIIVN